MGINLGIIMDPIQDIHFYKDTSLDLLIEAQKRGCSLWYMEQSDVHYKNDDILAFMKAITVKGDPRSYYQFNSEKIVKSFHDLDVVLMRKDPPVDLSYIYTTMLLEKVNSQKTLVLNHPNALRSCNEKLFLLTFPECAPPTLVTSQISQVQDFLDEHQVIILKSLESLGGQAVYKIDQNNVHLTSLLGSLTLEGSKPIMAQKYCREIEVMGDKRVLMINGDPFPYPIARMPKKGDFRGNLAAGALDIKADFTEKDRWICQQVGPVLKEKGLFFVGLDIIGPYLTEINVTSPTCAKEIMKHHNKNPSKTFFDELYHMMGW